MKLFEIGCRYGVLHMTDLDETIEIASRDQETVTLTDGRRARVLAGMAPDGSDEEVIRLGEVGCVAHGGVVRVCALRSKPDQETGARQD